VVQQAVDAMGGWTRWARQPQTLWLRKAAFQVHLWLGLGLGLYIVVLCLTGSALVFRDELQEAFATEVPDVAQDAVPLEAEAMRAAVADAYPGFEIVRIGDRFSLRRPFVEAWVERGDERYERFFSPYTGADLGDAQTPGLRAILWTARLHDELLLGFGGRFYNGLGSLLVTVLCLTGAIVWWPGVQRWKRSLALRRGTSTPRLLWDLHSAAGAWFFWILLIWAVSGFYLGVPQPFIAVVDAISDPEAFLGERPGDIALRWLVALHFGRWDSLTLKVVWAAMGAVPAVLLVTGVAMWWRRVLRRRALPAG
jgi:uncharacterized iron-regulated membrane protein